MTALITLGTIIILAITGLFIYAEVKHDGTSIPNDENSSSTNDTP